MRESGVGGRTALPKLPDSFASWAEVQVGRSSDSTTSPGGHRDFSLQIMMQGILSYIGVSKNKGTPKWMVYNGQPY